MGSIEPIAWYNGWMVWQARHTMAVRSQQKLRRFVIVVNTRSCAEYCVCEQLIATHYNALYKPIYNIYIYIYIIKVCCLTPRTSYYIYKGAAEREL